MAQFVAKDVNAEVKSDFLNNIIHSMDIGKDFRIRILKDHGIDILEDVKDGHWINLQKTLDIYKDIKEKIGDRTLYMIGSVSMDNKNLPFSSLEEALKGLNSIYQQLHRGSQLGGWKVLEYDEVNKKARIKSDNPYPSQLEKGMLMSILRKLRPSNSTRYNVFLDDSNETREHGGESCTYELSW